ncbi:MAG: hypothetical protein RL333_735 [Pseudomonadota bacterium]|jgi:hypothetical protein
MNRVVNRDRVVNEIHGEITRLLLQYWEVSGKPDLAEFMALIPIEPALEYIERSNIRESGSTHEINSH